MPTEHFKSKTAYRKWNAYRHIHGIPAPHLKTAVVAGKPHKVKHSELSEPEMRRERMHSDISKFKGKSSEASFRRAKRKVINRYA